jgi:hypothetical protein
MCWKRRYGIHYIGEAYKDNAEKNNLICDVKILQVGYR